jgi:hypothetical protein
MVPPMLFLDVIGFHMLKTGQGSLMTCFHLAMHGDYSSSEESAV